MRGLILGNSHLAAVRAGWPGTRGNPHFWALSGGGGPDIRLQDGRIVSARADATPITDIPGPGPRPADYDFVVLCSFGLSAVREEYAPHVLRRLALAEMALPGADGMLPVSQGFLEAAIGHMLTRIPAWPALRRIRSVFAGPVVCVPAPLPALALMAPDHPLRRAYGDNTARFAAWVADRQMRAMRDLAGRLDPPLHMLSHPDPDWTAAGATPPDFADPAIDLWHMNAAYGALVADQLCTALDIG